MHGGVKRTDTRLHCNAQASSQSQEVKRVLSKTKGTSNFPSLKSYKWNP